MGSGYTVTKSNYTLKKFHSNTSGGSVYVRDFMTTNNLGGWDSGSIPKSENGFKMVYRGTTSSKRQHNYGDYLTTENGSENWTMTNGASQSLTSESKIEANPDNSTLLSYAYYGSCIQLVQSGIRKIINNFPGEMWSKDEVIKKYAQYGVVLNNEFGIDISTKKLSGEEEASVNKLRYFCLSSGRYFVYSGGTSCGCVTKWEVIDNTDSSTICDFDKEIRIGYGGNEISIKRCILNNEYVYITSAKNIEIRLGEGDIELFFNSLDDFQKLLLNRKTTPTYTAILDFPHETERGIETYKKAFTWPTLNGWNLDIISQKYEKYINSLLDLASFYDEYNTDNLWKNMTHDSIKNMDITFSRKGSDEDKDDYNEGTSKVQGLLWAYGRQFDEIKKYIDSIKSVNTITYSTNGNIPDYFLTDTLNLNGWEVSSAVNGLVSSTSATTEEINKANITFLKNLKINSRNLLLKKGTRRGIEELLALFGYGINDSYILEEKIYTASANSGMTVTGDTELPAEYWNKHKIRPNGTERYESDDTLEGLPALVFEYYEGSTLKRTIIPWFKDVSEMDGQPYFQMYGGWKKISGNIPTYGESISYLNIVKKYSDLSKIPESKLLKKEYNIVYVNDISDYTGETESHYFKRNSGSTEWTQIDETNDKVREITSIIEEYRGNNPHTGYGNYDDGKEYMEYFKEIFKYSIDNDLFEDIAYNCENGEIKSEVTSQGFEITGYTDNKKCHYFYNEDRENVNTGIAELKLSSDTLSYISKNMGYVSDETHGIDIREKKSSINSIYKEPSIINVKNFIITFNIQTKTQDIEKKYIEKSILPYLTQMIPSTTILEIKYIIN